MEVFAYWNAETLKRVFDAIVMVIGGGGWSNILKSVAIIGLLLSVTIGLLRIQAQHSLGYLLFLAIWYFGLLLPTTSVIIVNRAGPSASPTYTVANVPLGLAFFASVTSSVGDWLTTRYETMFAMPADLQFQRNGLMFGSRLVRTGIEQARIEDPGVNADFMAFMKDCVHPELFDSPVVFSDFLKSTDLVATLDAMALNPARVALIANTSNTGLEAVPCTTAWNRLKGKLAAQATTARDRLSQLFFPGFSSADKATQIDASLVAADTVMLSVARTSLESVRQKMMINMVRDSNVSIATAINNPTLAQTALAQAMAEQSANTAYRVMAKIGEETLPLVRNAIEVVIYAIFPIIMLLIVGAGAMGGKVLGAYVLGMVWLQMWPALFAIVNSLTHERVADVMQGVAPGGESIATATALTSAGLGPEAIAGMLTLSIPLIAWAIVKGGEVAMSGVATGVMGPASASAQRAGDAVGVGNVAAGNVSWGGTSMNNASMNKSDSNIGWAAGAASIGSGLAGKNWDLGGSQGGAGDRAFGVLDLSRMSPNMGPIAMSQAVERSHQASRALSDARSEETSAGTSFRSSAAGLWRAVESSGSDQLRSSIEQAYFGTSQSGGSTTSSGQAASAGTSVGVGNQSQDAKRLGGSAGVNLGLGAGGASAGGGLDGSIGQSKTRIDAADFAKKYVDDKSFRSAVDSAIKGSVDQSEGTQGSASQRSGTGVEGALNETREAGRTFGEAQARRQSAETRNQEAQSAVASAAVNGGAILVAAIGEDGAIRLATAAATQPSGVSGALDTARNAGNSAFLGAGGAGSKGGAVPAPESGQFDALTQRVDGATANARAIIANGDASARAFAADAMQRAGIPVDTSVVAPQFASQVQALQTAAASGNAEAARAIAVMTERGYLQFEKSYNNPLPSGGGPTYQQMPPAPPRESAPPAARPR